MTRNLFLKLISSIPSLITQLKLNELENILHELDNTAITPLLFIGHGHPMNALYDNNFTQALKNMSKNLATPNAIMVVSAHWETRGTFVSVNPAPKAIYDFGGFDKKLFEIKYEPQGHPTMAKAVIESASMFGIKEDQSMGLDHGTWTILKYLYPKANVPVFQLSIDYTKPSSYHYQLAASLKKMREKGVLIIASGNIVHNLGIMDWNNIDAKPFDWAIEFDELVKTKLDNQEFESLINYQSFGKIAQLAIPTNDHYLPMLYTLGLAHKKEKVSYLYEGLQYKSISMRCFKIS
jgi:4,5-DOPA dioxygenase extradiol